MNRERETVGFLKRYPGVKIGIIALILLLVVGVSSAFTVEKEVQVNFEGKVYTASGKLLESLEEVLIANDLPISDEYKYSTSLNTLFKDVINVEIEKKISGKILVDGKTIDYLSGGATIGDVLDENGVKPDEDDKVEPGLNTPLTEKTATIKVTRISYVESTGIKDIPMKATIAENPELPTGTRVVVQVGQNGKANMKERICYENGIEVSREVITSEVIMPAIEEIIEVGPSTTIIMPEAVEVSSISGNVNVEKVRLVMAVLPSIKKVALKVAWWSVPPLTQRPETIPRRELCHSLAEPLLHGVVFPLGPKFISQRLAGFIPWKIGAEPLDMALLIFIWIVRKNA